MPRKIIYFDRETIKNMLQERNRGTKIKTTGVEGEANVAVTAKAEASSSIYLGVPFFARVKFLITGTLQSQFLLKYDSSTTITSTEISDFESIQKDFVEFKDKQVFDIENSSTFSGLDFDMAGKTGTAQQSSVHADHALFVGYAPTDSPEIAVAVRMAYGYSSSYAAEIGRDIASIYFDPDSADDLITGSAAHLGDALAGD